MSARLLQQPFVHIVEDDESHREAIARLLRTAGHTVQMYSSASDFVSRFHRSAVGCVVWHLLPWHNALDVQRILAFAEDPLPVVFLSGHHNVHQGVEAMKAGAVDFLALDESGETLVRAVTRALVRNLEERAIRERRRELRARYDRLTPRERDVFARLVDGKPNKEIGFELGISVQTTKIHRHRVLEKMRAASLVELARIADQLDLSARDSLRHMPTAAAPASGPARPGIPVVGPISARSRS